MHDRKVNTTGDLCPGAGEHSIGEFSQGDIFIAGYPKSGNNWMQHIVAGLAYGLDSIQGDVLQMVPDVHCVNTYQRQGPVMFFKTHFLPKPEYKRVIYLVRDGRDVMVSYYHYLSVTVPDPRNFLRMVRRGEHLFPCKWNVHVSEWMSNPHGAEMMICRYEDLKKNPIPEMKRLCAFAGIERDEEYLREVVQRTSFGELRKKEIATRPVKSIWPKDKFFFRRGEVGAYADEMPWLARKAFAREAWPALHKCGYVGNTGPFGWLAS